MVLAFVAAYGPELWSGSRALFTVRNALGALAVVLSMRFVLVRAGVIDGTVWSPSVPWLATVVLGAALIL